MHYVRKWNKFESSQVRSENTLNFQLFSLARLRHKLKEKKIKWAAERERLESALSTIAVRVKTQTNHEQIQILFLYYFILNIT